MSTTRPDPLTLQDGDLDSERDARDADRTYHAWAVYGRTNREGPFPLWKRFGDMLPHFATKAAAMRVLSERGIRLGGSMRLSLIRVEVTAHAASVPQAEAEGGT